MVDFTKFVTPELGATGIVVLIVLLILWGKLVPRQQLEDIRADRDSWKQAYELERAARIGAMNQVTTMMEVAKTTEAVMGAIPAAAAIEGSGSAEAVAQE